ncbi:glycosyltransferase [Thalassoglobus polymorphus]|uniref:GDP-mannose-dependent alpha-(1-6)-phosphatidylinositol monomannoside mannosyltransferase n=1 Tax=Thalassoglobus polymorphus TaxID=2527994 RepID=A0A517QSN6_9PLAN|nr:glycosyltransferase [Thalassoglobus polymorphus]QDT34639.1 GDP-mannose-dependent alpha-(1-6)-phosphatidylinositol monomannoside mannosyltransferase [Thalassoglobus polymorphus]
MRICIVQPNLNTLSETFIAAHSAHLPGEVSVIHQSGDLFAMIERKRVLSQGFHSKAVRKINRLITNRPWEWERTRSYLTALKKFRPDVVLAEYGPTGACIVEACRVSKIPLVVHFHGYDASRHDILERHKNDYQLMFDDAAAIIAVSETMKKRLLELGADRRRLHLNHYGVDVEQFKVRERISTEPNFLAVGRFVEKKAPYLTVAAFSKVVERIPSAKLRMIGDGPLLGVCKDLARALGIDKSLHFCGPQPHEVVANEMSNSFAFVQHSIEASNGDCEGTPNSILEAGASGKPVVSTRHAGIPDVVIDSETGYLVDERDVQGMANRMIDLALAPEIAARMGTAARERISTEFTMSKSIDKLFNILQSVTNKGIQ